MFRVTGFHNKKRDVANYDPGINSENSRVTAKINESTHRHYSCRRQSPVLYLTIVRAVLRTAFSNGRVLTLFGLVEPSGTERGRSWSFGVHLDSWASPDKSVRMITFCTCHDTTAWSCATSVRLHLQWCPSPSSKALFVGRAVRSS